LPVPRSAGRRLESRRPERDGVEDPTADEVANAAPCFLRGGGGGEEA